MAVWIASLPASQRQRILADLAPSETDALALLYEWRKLWARPDQLPPDGPWRIWLILTGRGWGKTRTGAEWVRERIECGQAKRIALVAGTPADARDVMIEGPSGILNVFPQDPQTRPLYTPTNRRITFARYGAVATVYSGADPEQLRGPQHDLAWCDELAAWDYPAETWTNLRLGMREADEAQTCITTTPKPIEILRDLVRAYRAGDQRIALTVGSTYDNAANLPDDFIKEIREKYEGTTIGQQEIHAALLDEMPGALWTRSILDSNRAAAGPQSFRKVVVAIDPAVKVSEESSETGIVVAGLGEDGHAYILADLSGRWHPHEWAQRAVGAYTQYRANHIVAEGNNGGDLVRHNLLHVNDRVPVKLVTASDGKYTRAEPVSGLYTQGRVHHVGGFAQLEAQMCTWVPGVAWSKDSHSPDRMDALVWAVTDLIPAVASIPTVKPLSLVGESKWL